MDHGTHLAVETTGLRKYDKLYKQKKNAVIILNGLLWGGCAQITL